MKRKFLSILCGCLITFSLVGCSSPTSYQDATDTTVSTISKANGYFTLITEWYDGYTTYQIVFANDTKVKYLICRNQQYNQGAYGITALYNTDGTLQIYEEE